MAEPPNPPFFYNAYPAGPQFGTPYGAFRAGNSRNIYYRRVGTLEIGKEGLLFLKENEPIHAIISNFDSNASGKRQIIFTQLKYRPHNVVESFILYQTKRGKDWEFMEESDFIIKDGYRPIYKGDTSKKVILTTRERNKEDEVDEVIFIKYDDFMKSYIFKYTKNNEEIELGESARRHSWEAVTEITYPAPEMRTPYPPSFGIRVTSGEAAGGAAGGAAANNSRKSRKSRKNRKNRKNKTRRA